MPDVSRLLIEYIRTHRSFVAALTRTYLISVVASELLQDFPTRLPPKLTKGVGPVLREVLDHVKLAREEEQLRVGEKASGEATRRLSEDLSKPEDEEQYFAIAVVELLLSSELE